MENFKENYTSITDKFNKRLIHNDHLNSDYKGYQLIIKYSLREELHDGYCSDPDNFREQNKEEEVSFWLLSFSKEFIHKYFTGHPKFIGNIDDIIKYFSNYEQIPYNLQAKINILKDLDEGETCCTYGSGYCGCKNYYYINKISIVDKYYEKEYISPNNLY